MFATGETVGLAKWIIDDTSLVCFGSVDFEKWGRTYGRKDVQKDGSADKICEYSDQQVNCSVPVGMYRFCFSVVVFLFPGRRTYV